MIPYLGEKSKFANFIIPNIPDDIEVYCEPFSGMFGIFFNLNLNNYERTQFVYNDINYLNYNLFNQIKEGNLYDSIKKLKVSKSTYLDSINNIDINNDLQLAINWLITLSCSSPYETGKDSWRGDLEFEIFKVRYEEYKQKIDRIDFIENKDYKEIIKKYDSANTFFYLDPPYKGKESYYINHNFNDSSHKELADILNNIKGKFILSYYYFDGIEDLYKGFKFESKRTIMGTEYLIMNC